MVARRRGRLNASHVRALMLTDDLSFLRDCEVPSRAAL